MNQYVKMGIIALGGVALTASGVIVANSIYTNTKVGIDKKNLMIAAGVGVAVAIVMAKMFNVKQA